MAVQVAKQNFWPLPIISRARTSDVSRSFMLAQTFQQRNGLGPPNAVNSPGHGAVVCFDPGEGTPSKRIYCGTQATSSCWQAPAPTIRGQQKQTIHGQSHYCEHGKPRLKGQLAFPSSPNLLQTRGRYPPFPRKSIGSPYSLSKEAIS